MKRAAFEKQQAEMPAERLVFLDEFSIPTALTPAYGRAPSRAARTLCARTRVGHHRLEFVWCPRATDLARGL